MQKGQPLSGQAPGVGTAKAASMNNFKFEITNFNPEVLLPRASHEYTSRE